MVPSENLKLYHIKIITMGNFRDIQLVKLVFYTVSLKIQTIFFIFINRFDHINYRFILLFLLILAWEFCFGRRSDIFKFIQSVRMLILYLFINFNIFQILRFDALFTRLGFGNLVKNGGLIRFWKAVIVVGPTWVLKILLRFGFGCLCL